MTMREIDEALERIGERAIASYRARIEGTDAMSH